MKHLVKMKMYREMSKDKLEDELQRFNLEISKSYGIMGMAKSDKKDKAQPSTGSDIVKRLKKERARIETILKEKSKGGEI